MYGRVQSVLARASTGALFALALCAASAGSAFAQAAVRITGTVTEAGTGAPIADAQVTVVGTERGAVTNAAGRFAIDNVSSGARLLRTRKIGYAAADTPITIAAAGATSVSIVLRLAPTQLNEVVVTGTPGGGQRRTIGNAVTQIDVADVTSKSSNTTVSEVLQGRTPGVVVSAGSGAPGTSAEITIRGYGSFTNNRPVVFIDGVRMDTDDIGAFNPSGAGTSGFSGQRTSALDLINPQDIESMEVIKGPAAATLFGADAAGGVIQIITKKGRRGQQPLRWTTRYETGRNEWGTETLTNYTTCTPARIAARDAAGNPLWIGCQGVEPNTILTDDPLRRDAGALRTGAVSNFSASLQGGGDRFSFRVSGDGLLNEGVLENNFDKRRSLRTNFSFNANNRTDFSVSVGYIRQNLRLPLGDEAGNGLLLSAARGIPGLTRPRAALAGWGTIEPSLAHRYNNSAISDRFTVGSTINYAPFRWWQNRLILGMDWRATTAQLLSLPGDPDVPAGLNALRAPKAYNYTADYAGTVTTLLRNIESQTSFGAQLTARRDETITATGSSLPTREVTIIGAALNISGGNSYSEFNSIGFFGRQQLGWNNRLFVSGAVRVDDHSSFGSDFDMIIYPKADFSWVLSEEPRFQGLLQRIHANDFRLRAAWGRAGRAPAPYSAVQTYGSGRVALGTSAVGGTLFASSIGNPDLKPEKGEEIELGFESNYLDGRAGIDFTFYRKKMVDLLVPIAIPPSLGFAGSMLQNLGETINRGTELGLTLSPISRPGFGWDARVSMSFNKNRLEALDTIRVCKPWAGEACPAGKSPAEEIPGGASYSPGMQRNRIGYPLGSYFVRKPMRTEDGSYVLNLNAAGQITTAVYDTAFTFLGQAVPKRLISLSNTFTLFRNLRLYALLDYQGGHYLYNQKSYNRCATVANGPNCEFLNRAEDIGTARLDTLRAVFAGTSTPLTVTSPMTQSQYVEKADFMKLRDVSLTYTVPASVVRRFRADGVNIVLAGKNLGLWTDYTGLDPEVNGYSNNQIRGSGNAAQFVRVDAYSWPMIRRYSLSLNVTY